MPNSQPTAGSSPGRLLDDDEDMPLRWSRRAAASRDPERPYYPRQAGASRTEPVPDQPRRLAAPAAASADKPLQPAQRACYEALGLALQEGHVFAAVTGPQDSGKTTVLEAVLADRHDRALRCIRISDPDQVPARLAAQIEQVAYAEASKTENLERHVVLVIDDAHAASDELLRCLARLAAMREPGRRVPQILLVGRPELWNRLATEEFAPLARRIAIRANLPKLEDEQDPWASLEQEVSQTMSQLRAEREQVPALPEEPVAPRFERGFEREQFPTPIDEAGLPLDPETIPPPTDYAIFMDPAPQAEAADHESRGERRRDRRRLLLPLGCLLVAVAACGVVLSFYDWPDLFDDVPGVAAKPTTFVFDPPSDGRNIPRIPSWAQPGSHVAQAATPQPVAPVPAGAAAAPAPPPPAPDAPPKPAAAVAAAAAPSLDPPTVDHPAAPQAIETARAEPAPPPPAPVQSPSASSAAQEAPSPAPPPDSQATAAATPPAPVQPAPARAAAHSEPTEPPVALAALATPLPVPPPHPSRPAAIVKPAPLSPAIVGLLLRRGEEQLAIGDVSAARLYFERAAESGNPQAALHLARTYDAAFLPAADKSSLADRGAARIWYGRAASLGEREAVSRLKELNESR